MESKKTIEYLNNKTWYRFLKVVFWIFVLLSVVIFNVTIITIKGVRNIDNSKTLIICTYGEKQIFTPKQVDIKLSLYQIKESFNYKIFFEGYNNNEIKTILENCYKQIDKNIDIYAIQKVYEVWGNDRLIIKKDERPPLTEAEKKYLDEVIPKIENTYINSDKTKYLDYNIKLFDIKPVYTYIEFIKYFIIGNLIILLFFEIFRRIFYYIILGSFKPQK